MLWSSSGVEINTNRNKINTPLCKALTHLHLYYCLILDYIVRSWWTQDIWRGDKDDVSRSELCRLEQDIRQRQLQRGRTNDVSSTCKARGGGVVMNNFEGVDVNTSGGGLNWGGYVRNFPWNKIALCTIATSLLRWFNSVVQLFAKLRLILPTENWY